MDSYSLADAKAHLSELIDRVQSGEDISITRHGKTVARLVAAKPDRKPISYAELKALTDAQPYQSESAADFVREPSADSYGRAVAALGEAAEVAGKSGVRLALEFQKGSRFCASLDTAVALVMQAGGENLGVCLDLFHYYTARFFQFKISRRSAYINGLRRQFFKLLEVERAVIQRRRQAEAIVDK